ncbi:fl(2)d-associated complex component isoform X1 [Culex pipiens pallens]|uniref:fl(2)d-associated complex component isoform X1 n=1 Tax=Culex pipiens pallens TaxID=42434 RepID=UPI0019532A54|nr:fl(2)d-associated complex component isoform X1 [Culex pipiens pallens]
MSTPVKRKITLELNPNKKVLPKDRPSVFQRLGTKKFPLPGGGGGGGVGGGPSSSVSSTAAVGSGQEATLNKEEIVKRIVGCDEPPEPVPPPKIVPESVSAHARLIEAQLAAKLGKVIVSRGETIGAPPAPVPPVASSSAAVSTSGHGVSSSSTGRKESEPVRGDRGERDRGGHTGSKTTGGERGGGSGKGTSGGGGGGEGWDQSSLENADQDILERKRKELQHELKLEMDASGGGGGGGGGHHHHHHHSSSSSSAALKQKASKETLTVVKKRPVPVRKVPVSRRRSSSSSDSSSSSGSDSSDSDSSSSSSSSSRDSSARRPATKKRGTVRQRRGSSSSSDGGAKTKLVKKHVKKVSADGTKRIVTKKVAGGHVTKIRVKKVTSPGGTSHLRKVRDVSPGGKVGTKYTVKKVVAVKKDKLAVVVDARERVREKEREMVLQRKRELAIKEKVPSRKSRSPRSHIRSRSPRSRLSPRGSSRGREMLKKKSPEPVARYREAPATVVRRAERSPDPRLDDRRGRHESVKDRDRGLRERELSRAKEREREEALARCQERQRERDRLASAGKERDRAVPPPAPSSGSGSVSRSRDLDGGLDKPDRHRPVERLLPRPAERARALAAARSPGKHDHDRSRTPNSPRATRDRLPRERSYDRYEHHDRRSRSHEREYPPPQQTIVRGARARDSPYERHPPPPAPAGPIRRDDYREDRPGYERDRGGRHDYGRNEYPDDPPPRRDHVERDWGGDREPPRNFDRRGPPPEDRGTWDRGDHHGPPQHSHGPPHDQEPYQQGSSRNWEDQPRWKEADGWVNDKDRPDWKYGDQRPPPKQWEHDDHPGGHTHNHGGGRPGRWQGPDQNQGPGNWHGKPKEDMDFGGPRHKLAGRLGDVPDRGGMFRRHTHQGPPPMYHHDRKMDRGGGHMDRGGRGGRFGPPNRYSINRTQQNLANQQMQHQHEHHHPHGPPMQHQQQPCGGGMPPSNPNAQPVMAPQVPEVKEEIPSAVEPQPSAAAPDAVPPADQPTPQPIVAASTEEMPPPNEDAEKVPDEPVTSETPAEEGDKPAEPEAAVAAEPMDEDNLSEISDDPDDILTREEEDDFGESEPLETVVAAAAPPPSTALSSSMMIPSQVLQNHQQSQDAQNQPSLPPRRPFLSKARYKSYDGCIGGPAPPALLLPDLYANVDDGGGGTTFRVGTGEIALLNESAAAAAATADKQSAEHGESSTADGLPQEGSELGAAATSEETAAQQHPDPKDPKVAGKLHANKELKKDFETLDFEEISDGELEEENKFKGLGDALGVDWASLAQETRAKLRPEQTIPVSARNRWKAHHILLDIGISVRLAGEAYAQRVLTESKDKLRDEIHEFKAAAAAQKQAAVKREEEAQQLFHGVKIKKEVLDEDEQKEVAEREQQAAIKEEAESAAAAEEQTEQEANLAEMDKILHPVASVHVAMRERARARRNLILRAAGPCSRALSARRDLEIRRQLCGFPPQECNERITESAAATAGANAELHDAVMKLFQATMQPAAATTANKIEVQ